MMEASLFTKLFYPKSHPRFRRLWRTMRAMETKWLALHDGREPWAVLFLLFHHFSSRGWKVRGDTNIFRGLVFLGIGLSAIK